MSIQEWSDNIVVVNLQDDPDFSDDVNALTERMEKEPRNAVLDFTKVKFLNSSNISKLLKLRKTTLDAKRKLYLCGIPIQVWGVFLLTGLDTLFDVAEDPASALATLQMK
jgi:anti-anti-sigma factor